MRLLGNHLVAHSWASPRCWSVSLVGYFHSSSAHGTGAANDIATPFDGSQPDHRSGGGLSRDRHPRNARDAGSSNEGLPQCRVEGPSTRIRNARIGRRVKESGVVLRELKVYGAILSSSCSGLRAAMITLLTAAGQHPRERHTGRAKRHAVRPLPSARPRRDSPSFSKGRNCRFGEACAGRRRVSAAVLA